MVLNSYSVPVPTLPCILSSLCADSMQRKWLGYLVSDGSSEAEGLAQRFISTEHVQILWT